MLIYKNMFYWDLKKKVIAGALFSGIVFSVLFYAFVIYQSPEKTNQIYKSALEDLQKGDYQNAYYLFSRITIFSNLKPVAIYHRAECAKMLGDKKSELKQYQFLFNNYPKHKLSLKAKYLTAQRLVYDNSNLAEKYFNEIISSSPNTDYGIASKYYIGVILKNQKDKSHINEIQNNFRFYLENAPSGRHAYNVVKNWLEVADSNTSKDDYLLMANTCYLFGEYEQAEQLLQRTDIKKSWVLSVKNSYKLRNYQKIKSVTENGLQHYSYNVPEDDVIEVIDIYNEIYPSGDLSAFATGKGRDYIANKKCLKMQQKDKIACYTKLYMDYPQGRFSADALSNIFFSKIKSGDYENAKKIGKDHLNKFADTNSAPMVMFWLGKLYEKNGNYDEYSKYYKRVIENFPDNYYAYRAYLRLKGLIGPIITSNLNPKVVEYPYKYTKDNIIVKLVDLGDYDAVNEFADDDEFIKSWVLYKKGDYSHSMLVARDAMENLKDKPNKYDMRWRLVYPVLYYDEVKKYAKETGNNLPLMLGLIREESYFDPLAQSFAGASGLMQLMPATANEISSKFSLGGTGSVDLFNPEKNIKLGNYYYEFLRNNLEGYDVSSIAAYNGGIGSLKNWKTSLNYNDTDEFIEQIPYPETKNYVKKVFRSYWNYVRVYSGNS
ncbi:transglycosylase SLT domain-containing protein [bacterium]|nr:transglycosylase SLT domain-containing protein [bacterium]